MLSQYLNGATRVRGWTVVDAHLEAYTRTYEELMMTNIEQPSETHDLRHLLYCLVHDYITTYELTQTEIMNKADSRSLLENFNISNSNYQEDMNELGSMDHLRYYSIEK